jgi:TrmH family RNA methyltransferase
MLAAAQNIALEKNDGLLERLAHKGNIYVFGVFAKYQMQLSAGSHLVLVNPREPGNLGTIIRTMLAFQLPDLVLINPATDVFHPHVIRAAIGANFLLNAAYMDSFETYAERYPRAFYPFMLTGSRPLETVSFAQPASLIFGPEWPGLPKSFQRFGGVRIAQNPAVESLSLPVAVAIALYAWQGQARNN